MDYCATRAGFISYILSSCWILFIGSQVLKSTVETTIMVTATNETEYTKAPTTQGGHKVGISCNKTYPAETKGAYHLAKKKKNWKFRLQVKWNSNFPENPLGN